MGEVLETCRTVSGSDAAFTWVDEPFLLEREVGQWMEVPLWIAESDPEWAHMQEADVSRARAAGLAFRPLEDTVRDTLAWAGTKDGWNDDVGLDPERERELLAEWHR
jgi:2'-hydroxyisoflavone reductase